MLRGDVAARPEDVWRGGLGALRSRRTGSWNSKFPPKRGLGLL